MQIPEKFDPIRPFEPEELPEAFARLMADEQFKMVLNHAMPGITPEAMTEQLQQCKTNLDFQKAFCYGFLRKIVKENGKDLKIDRTSIDLQQRYTFVSNHRDIVLDSAFLDILLIEANCDTTCEIAIGDNLLAASWIKDLVRINKSFIVERGLTPRKMLEASQRLSEYMHFAIQEKHENIWIAQREGRAKDSDDRTQVAVLKMMSMGGEGNWIERLIQLHIVPLTISYEYDPCDFLKAREMQLKRDNAEYKKTRQDDILSMQTGMMGYKGSVHYHCSPCIDQWLQTLDPKEPKGELYERIAHHIDMQIHKNYRIYANNYVALDLLEGTETYQCHYTNAERKDFEQYVERQIEKIELPNKDVPFLRKCILTMYANPLKNFLATQAPE